MFHQVNVALQVLPTSGTKHPYAIVDRAIEIIHASGVKYRVCPFETVMEGDYDTIMEVVRKIQLECLDFGAESMISNLKIQISRDEDVRMEDKTGKYEKKG
jgi:uncharacterized protein YqgV (UPF0045/DUF77 family)